MRKKVKKSEKSEKSTKRKKTPKDHSSHVPSSSRPKVSDKDAEGFFVRRGGELVSVTLEATVVGDPEQAHVLRIEFEPLRLGT